MAWNEYNSGTMDSPFHTMTTQTQTRLQKIIIHHMITQTMLMKSNSESTQLTLRRQNLKKGLVILKGLLLKNTAPVRLFLVFLFRVYLFLPVEHRSCNIV